MHRRWPPRQLPPEYVVDRSPRDARSNLLTFFLPRVLAPSRSSFVHMRPRSLVRFIHHILVDSKLTDVQMLCKHFDVSSLYFSPTVVTAASEVSSILESRIAGSSMGSDVQETGRVLTIGDGMSFILNSPKSC